MLKLLFIYLNILIFTFSLKAQQANADSLISLLDKTTKDTIKLICYTEICQVLPPGDSLLKFSYADSAVLLSEKIAKPKYKALAKKNMASVFQFYNKNTEAVPYYKSAELLFAKLGDRKEQAKIFYELAKLMYRLDDFQESINYHQKSLDIRYELKDTVSLIQSEYALGMMCWRLGDFKNAEKHFLISIPMSEKINDTQSVLSAMNSLGAIYWGYGNYNIALGYYEKALKSALAIGNKRKIALITINIGLIYHEWGKDEEAMNNYIEGLKIAQKENYPYGIAYGYSNMGVIYLKNKEYEKSIISFDSALVNYQKISKKIGIAYSYRNMGDSYFEAKKLNKAIYYYKLSVKTAREVDSKHHLALALYALANAYFETENYQLVNKRAKESLQISIDQKYHGILKDNYFLLSKLAEITNLPELALGYYKNASSLKDSIFNEKSSKQFAEIQTKYETEKKVLLLERQKEEIEKNQIIIEQGRIQKYGLSFIIFLLFVFAYFGIKAKNKLAQKNKALNEKYVELGLQNDLLEKQKTEIEKINKELNDLTKLKELNTQMIVHDLKNPLNRIISTSKKKKTEAEKKLYESSQYMLNLVENILSVAKIEQTGIHFSVTAVNLNEIILSAYENTSFLFHNKGIIFLNKMKANCKVIAENYLLKRIFINLFTNAAKFTPSGGEVSISAKQDADRIIIEVNDTGIGVNPENIDDIFDIYKYDEVAKDDRVSSTGIGLFFIKNALEALGSKIQVKSQLNKGTSFSFSLKIMEKLQSKPKTIEQDKEKYVLLTADEFMGLKDVLHELAKTELYEVSKIKKLKSRIKPETRNVEKWLKLINESIANYNTELFQKLINNDYK